MKKITSMTEENRLDCKCWVVIVIMQCQHQLYELYWLEEDLVSHTFNNTSFFQRSNVLFIHTLNQQCIWRKHFSVPVGINVLWPEWIFFSFFFSGNEVLEKKQIKISKKTQFLLMSALVGLSRALLSSRLFVTNIYSGIIGSLSKSLRLVLLRLPWLKRSGESTSRWSAKFEV